MTVENAEQRALSLLIAAITAMALLAPLVKSASAEAPSAIVEEVTGNATPTQVFDFLRAGDVLELGPSDALVLGYLTSCLRETITGGRVTIGESQSTVEHGSVVRETVDCHGGQSDLSSTEAVLSGGFVLRTAGTAR